MRHLYVKKGLCKAAKIIIWYLRTNHSTPTSQQLRLRNVGGRIISSTSRIINRTWDDTTLRLKHETTSGFEKIQIGKDPTTIYKVYIYIYIKLTHGTCLFQDAPTTCYFCSRVKSYNNRPTKTTAKNTCNNGSPTKSTCFWAVELPYSPKTVRSALAKLRCAFSISSRTMTSFPQQISYPSTTSWAKRGIW